jgi:hypothetical protein
MVIVNISSILVCVAHTVPLKNDKDFSKPKLSIITISNWVLYCFKTYLSKFSDL